MIKLISVIICAYVLSGCSTPANNNSGRITRNPGAMTEDLLLEHALGHLAEYQEAKSFISILMSDEDHYKIDASVNKLSVLIYPVRWEREGLSRGIEVRLSPDGSLIDVRPSFNHVNHERRWMFSDHTSVFSAKVDNGLEVIEATLNRGPTAADAQPIATTWLLLREPGIYTIQHKRRNREMEWDINLVTLTVTEASRQSVTDKLDISAPGKFTIAYQVNDSIMMHSRTGQGRSPEWVTGWLFEGISRVE